MSQAVPLPKMGLTMEEATLVKWHKKIGDLVKKSEILLEIETDKSILEIEAPLSGLLMDQRYQEGDVIPVSAVICHIGQTNQPGVPGDRTDYVPDPNDIPENKTRILLSPAARRKARELGLKVEDLQSLPGSGPSNRIVLKDLELYSSKMNRQSNEQDHMPISNFQSTDQNNHIVVLNNIRSITARKLTASFRDVPQFTIKRRVDLSNINKIRNTFQSIGIKLSINDFFIQAAARALEKNEFVNACFSESENELRIIKNREINIGLAVALDKGLMVPVVKNANQLSLVDIAKKRDELIQKARSNRLSRDEITGGTFTISNLGSFEVDEFTAIINSPEAAILAVGSAIKQPIVVENDQTEVRSMLTMTAAFDHRILDGADAAKFMKDLVQFIESDEWKII